MQLSRRPTLAPPTDLSRGLSACAAALGQRPAVTVLRPQGRQEQGFVTLAQWAAKGAHLLQTDAFLTPGDVVFVDMPPSWQLASVCAAVWWAGGTVATDGPAGAVAAVVHELRMPPSDVEVCFVVGDAVDGGTTVASTLPAWTDESALFPDAPPACAATADGAALRTADGTLTHAEAIEAVSGQTDVLGLDVDDLTGSGVLEVAARPVVVGRATVVLATGTPRSDADGDAVGHWA